jgi:hypothetical protein
LIEVSVLLNFIKVLCFLNQITESFFKIKKMKTILIATDFSPASRNASMFGIQLAKAFKPILFCSMLLELMLHHLN